MSIPSRLGSALAIASIALLAVGCVRVQTTPPIPTIRTPATTTQTELPAPTPWAKIACSDLASPQDFSALLNGPVKSITVPTNHELLADRGPVSFSLRQVGGIECEWSNDVPAQGETGRNLDFVGVSVWVLPHAAQRWAEYKAYYQDSTDENYGCAAPGVSDRSGSCAASVLAGDNWVEIQIAGLLAESSSDLEAATRTLATRVSEAVRNAAPSTSRWSAPAGTQQLPRDCSKFFSTDEVEFALGAREPLILNGLDGGVSVTSSAWASAGTTPCPWVGVDGIGGAGYHGWLPGGEWAWNETLSSAAPGTYRKMAVPGLRPSDRAYSRCIPTDLTCFADLLIAHNWIQIAVNQLGPEAKTASAPTALAALAAAAVKNLAAG